MLKLDIKKNLINQEQEHSSSFLLQPLDSSQGITLGNTVRRNLLSNTPSLSLYAIEINDAKNEFESLKGIREDILEIIFNLKDIVYNLPLKVNFYNEETIGYLIVKGPKIVTANFLKFPKNLTRIVNPLKYICTITEKSSLFLELRLKFGRGYTLNCKEFNKNNNLIYINTNYCPIKNVTYLINLCYNNNGLLKESLLLDITTNGSCTPTRCLFESLKYLHKNVNILMQSLILTH